MTVLTSWTLRPSLEERKWERVLSEYFALVIFSWQAREGRRLVRHLSRPRPGLCRSPSLADSGSAPAGTRRRLPATEVDPDSPVDDFSPRIWEAARGVLRPPGSPETPQQRRLLGQRGSCLSLPWLSLGGTSTPCRKARLCSPEAVDPVDPL